MLKLKKIKTILITGLDGSGKSTLLSKLEGKSANKNFKILLLPKIEEEKINKNTVLYKVAKFVNYLNYESDVAEIPQLKAVALFASMLLYKKIEAQIIDKQTKLIFCERHPLIDTGVYARFYAEKLKPGSIQKDILNELDAKFSDELDYILSLLPVKNNYKIKGKCALLIHFIYQTFHIEKKYDLKSLKELFKIDLPDEIYYLKAAPNILYNRIKTRKVLEAHETVEVFSLLGSVYQRLLGTLKEFHQKVEIVNTENLNEIDEVIDLLLESAG